MLRDPRYLLPLGLLIAVIMISFASGRGSTHAAGTPHATTTANAQPTATDAAVDEHRTGDLQRLSDALNAYHTRNGAYPGTRNTITTMCVKPDDAGCALKATAADLPFGDGNEPYWYASDGARFVVIARAKVAPQKSSCPLGLPPELAASPLICMSGEAN